LSRNGEIRTPAEAKANSAKACGVSRDWWFALRSSQDQGFVEVDGLVDAVMLGSLRGLFIQEVEAEGILVFPDLVEQPVPKDDPFFLANLTLENGFLHPRSEVFAGLGHPAQSALAGFLDGGNIVGDEDQHGFTWEQTECNRANPPEDAAPAREPE
jgi:hypothetical protein